MPPRPCPAKKCGGQPQPPTESGEEFRLSDVASDSDVSVNDPLLPSSSEPVQLLRAHDAPSDNLSGLDWHPDSDPDIAAKDDKSTAADIHYFFKKAKGQTVCQVCR
jgi:hypothetical protein